MRLNLKGTGAGRLPPLILMTDDERLSDPLAAARALPPGSIVVLRSRDPRHRAELASRMRTIAKQRRFLVLAAGDPELARNAGLDGLHLPEERSGEALHWRAVRPDWLITVAAHSLGSMRHAAVADAFLLAPVFATTSHPGRRALSPMRANLIVGMVPAAVYALGGVDAANAKRLAGPHYAGIAAVSALST